MTYKLPEPAIYDAAGKQFGYSDVQMQQAYQAGREVEARSLTRAYEDGFSKGRDAMRQEAVKVCDESEYPDGWDLARLIEAIK